MLDTEFKYYIEHQEELVKKYNGKFLVIIGTDVVDSYNSEVDAYFNSIRKYKLGTFLIQYCTPGTDAYTQTFHSRVTFA